MCLHVATGAAVAHLRTCMPWQWTAMTQACARRSVSWCICKVEVLVGLAFTVLMFCRHLGREEEESPEQKEAELDQHNV
jgi:hypothetical protein